MRAEPAEQRGADPPHSLPLVRRLRTFETLSPGEIALLESVAAGAKPAEAGRELVREGRPQAPFVLVAGWACRSRLLPDGRRQIFDFLLPGDLTGCCRWLRPVAQTSLHALTAVEIAPAGSLLTAVHADPRYRNLAAACAKADALTESLLLNHVVRLGRQTAYERLSHLLLELCWRMELAGLGTESRFVMPLTQEVLADNLGLSIVHVNRTLQQLRHDGMLQVKGGRVVLLQRELMAAVADFQVPVLAGISEDRTS